MVRCLPPDAVANDPSRLTPTAIPNAVVALEIARPRVMGSISPRAIDRCKMRASSGPETDEAGRSRPCARRICGKITGEEAVVLKIPGIAAVVIIPGGGRRVPLQKRLVRALRQRRARRSHESGSRDPFVQSLHVGMSMGRAVTCNMDGSSPNRPSSRRACRAGTASRGRLSDPTRRCLGHWAKPETFRCQDGP
jgi:hypothetical protein